MAVSLRTLPSQTSNIMQVINTKTGEDVTRDYLALLEGKMTKQEFEKKYNLKSITSKETNESTLDN